MAPHAVYEAGSADPQHIVTSAALRRPSKPPLPSVPAISLTPAAAALTFIVLDNNIYGLTKGQFSPTSLPAEAAASTPYGNIQAEPAPILLAITCNATFVARVFSGNPSHMAQIITQAVQHKGFSFIQAFSPCLTFAYPYDHYVPRMKMIPKDHGPGDRHAAVRFAIDKEWIQLSVFYRDAQATDLGTRLEAVASRAAHRAPADLYSVLARVGGAPASLSGVGPIGVVYDPQRPAPRPNLQ